MLGTPVGGGAAAGVGPGDGAHTEDGRLATVTEGAAMTGASPGDWQLRCASGAVAGAGVWLMGVRRPLLTLPALLLRREEGGRRPAGGGATSNSLSTEERAGAGVSALEPFMTGLFRGN